MGNTHRLRYFLSPSSRIRIEWDGQTTAGLVHGRTGLRDARIAWLFDVPPDDIAELALACALSRGDYDVPGAEFGGVESMKVQDEAIRTFYATATTEAA